MNEPDRPKCTQAKSYFLSIKFLYKKVKLEQQMLQTLKEELNTIDSTFGKLPVMTSNTCDFTDLWNEIDAAQHRVNMHLNQYLQRRREALLLIDSLDRDLEKAVLIHYYINFHTIEKTAEIMEYSARHIQRLLKNGLKLAQEKLS